MKIRRLGWAGVELEHDGVVVVLDLLEDHAPLGPALALDQPLPPPSRLGGVNAAAVSHLHADHTDPAALQRALQPGAPVFRPEPGAGPYAGDPGTSPVEDRLRASGLSVDVVKIWESREMNGFTFTACPAVDGLGDPQVSWVVEAGGVRVLHGGDTMNHGYWWGIRAFVGKIDIAFLPINGPILRDVPGHVPDSLEPAVLMPEQAAAAARILGAHTVIPIHYGLDRPELYSQTPDALARFVAGTRSLNLSGVVLEPGQSYVTG